MTSNIKKYIATLLLFVFSYSILPASLFHSLFADHTDTEDNYCNYYHKDIGTHLEEKQVHCEILKVVTPLYDAVKVNHHIDAFLTVISTCKDFRISSYAFETPLNLPSRGPPAC